MKKIDARTWLWKRVSWNRPFGIRASSTGIVDQLCDATGMIIGLPDRQYIDSRKGGINSIPYQVGELLAISYVFARKLRIETGSLY